MFAKILKAGNTAVENAAALVVNLFHMRTYAHLLHLQTTSYAQHMALDGLYNDLPGLADAWVEAYMGNYGRITSYPNIKAEFDTSTPLAFIDSCIRYLKDARYGTPQDTELQNALDEIATLLDSTAYKLKNLS